MEINKDVERGWQFAAEILGADLFAQIGNEYVGRVEEAIKQLEDNINFHNYRNQDIDHFQGYVLEEWSAGTFNINAAAAGSKDHAEVLRSTGKNSVDIQTNFGKDYSAKSYKTAAETAKAQAKLDPETGQAAYKGQHRLVPTDQLEGAKSTAKIQELRNSEIRPEVSKAYAETEAKLTDRITNDKGISSDPRTRKKLEEVARKGKSGEYSAADEGITAANVIKTEYMLKNALKAGAAAAALTAIMEIAPEIFKAVDHLVKHGELDVEQIKKSGIKAVSDSAESFLRGFVSAVLEIVCESGKLGAAFKGLSPSILGALVALTMQTVKNSILVAAGKMSAKQMGAAFVDSAVISGGYLLGAKIGGAIGQAIGFEFPVVGYLLGSLIGTAFCAAYNVGKKKLISFCVDTGFTCFGLVEQDYELPEEVLNELGIETIPVPRTQIDFTEVPRTAIPTADVAAAGYETIGFTVLRRGVISVGRIGYV